MNDFQDDAVKRYIHNYNTFLYLLQNRGNKSDEEIVHLLQDNHNMSRSLLIDLGVTFKEVDTIRNLNNRVRELESSQSSSEISYDKVSIYIKQISDKVKSDLSGIGIYALLDVGMTPNLEIKIRIMSSMPRDGSRSSFRTEEEFVAYGQKKLEEHQRFMTNFEVLNRSNDGFVVAYTNSNLALIQDCVEKSIGSEVGNLEFVLDNVYDGEKPNHRIVPYISELTLRFWTLPSSRSFSDAMNNRY
jgi:hypothetical protein